VAQARVFGFLSIMTNLCSRHVLGILCALWLALPASAQTGGTRIGTIDLRKVFDNYWKTKQAEAGLKDRAAEMEKQYKEMTDDWKKQKAGYDTLVGDANNQALSADEREKRKKAADDKLRQMRELENSISLFRRNSTEQIDSQRKRLRDNIVEEIRNVLNAKAKAAGYALVIDTSADSASSTPIVLYNGGDTDMTNEILSQLNATAADSPGTADSAAPKRIRGKSSLHRGRGVPVLAMSAFEIVGPYWLKAAAGAVNAIAGGGTLITFPALLAVGTSPVIANATSTVALLVATSGS
jgi:outer membrane protein